MLAKLSSVRIMSAASRATSVPALPIAMPMSAALSAGASLTPSPVIATTSLHRLQRLGDAHLVLGHDAREDDLAGERLLERVVVHLLEVGAGDDVRVGRRDDADLARDRLGGQAVVAGDHDDADAGGVALGDGVGDLGARRVLHRLEAEQRQALLHRVAMSAASSPALDRALGDRDDAQRLRARGGRWRRARRRGRRR